MPNQLSLDSTANADMESCMADCAAPGQQCSIMVTGTVRSKAGGKMMMDVESAECQDMEDDEGSNEETPPPTKPAAKRSPMAKGVSKAAMMMGE